LLAVYLLGVMLSRIVGWISSTDGNVITTDVIFSLQSVMGVLVAVATGTALVHVEIEQKTLYTILSRPLPRWQFVVGKYVGLCLALIAGQLAMLVIGLIYLFATGAEVHHWLVIAGVLTTLEVVVMEAVSFCMTAVSSPLLAAELGRATYALGHAVHSLPGLVHHLKGVQQTIAIAFASVVPDLGQFAYRNEAVYRTPISLEDFALRVLYGLLWCALLVVITISVIRKKQL
jgi:ABC-type transport system involved in multi-copper enzyme maturation permease subunit